MSNFKIPTQHKKKIRSRKFELLYSTSLRVFSIVVYIRHTAILIFIEPCINKITYCYIASFSHIVLTVYSHGYILTNVTIVVYKMVSVDYELLISVSRFTCVATWIVTIYTSFYIKLSDFLEFLVPCL